MRWALILLDVTLSLLAAKDFFAAFSGSQEEFYQDDLVNLSNVTKNEHLRSEHLLEEYR